MSLSASPNSRFSRILSIQSHVVSGYVGNRAATFPLQLLGWDVDALNTVQFSNHLGYGHHGGDKMSVDHLISCIDGLERNGLLNHTALLTGFTPGAEGVEALEHIFRRLRSHNPDLVCLVDPVMGDDGRLYVSEKVIPKYKNILSCAAIATPNQFEAQLLTDINPDSIHNIRSCLRSFHSTYKIPHIVISSISLPASELGDFENLPMPDIDGNLLVCVGSTQMDASSSSWIIILSKRQQRYDGVGDLFASILLGRFLSATGESRLKEAAEFAVATTQGVLDTTQEYSSHFKSQASRAQSSELKIIQGRDSIENPIVSWKAVPL